MTAIRRTDPVRTYLEDIGRVPLLTHEQEIVLGKQVQQRVALEAIRDRLQEESEDSVSLATWAEAASTTEHQLRQILRDGERAKTKMVKANLRLVVSVAKKYIKSNLEFLDLIQEGTLGLYRGVEKFDPAKGYRFSTYAYWWIRQAITRAIAEQSRTIRLPIHVVEQLNKIRKVRRQLSQKLGRSPRATEIAEEANIPIEKVRYYLDRSRQPLSLDITIGENDNNALGDFLPDDGDTPEDVVTSRHLRQDLSTLMAELTQQQQDVITLRFGLRGEKPLTLAKVGDQLDISRERVRQIQQDALRHLRRKRQDLRAYMAAL
ncbi:MAG: RpoD/SigA family RNA polymerase sigma factor [Cyanobacteria bacterium P01_A01_bin.135]